MGGHLLVVDDSPTIRKLVELTFRSTSWTVDFASSGREGIAMARSGQPDIVLLDFVLPDMRGVEVCATLARDPRTQATQVILMSAKDESIRQLFKPFPAVVDFVPKPFSSEELLARVRTASVDEAGRPRPSQRARVRFTYAQKEAAAKAIYSKMSKAFALIPSWLAEMGERNASVFFARKILSPELMEDVLEALLPVYRELSCAQAREAGSSPPSDESPLSGRLCGWSGKDVCAMFGAGGRTGELRLARADATVIAYYRRGEIVFVTSLDPADHLGSGARGAFAEDLAAAEAEQRTTGKPVEVSLAELGHAPGGADLRSALQRAGRRLLEGALDSRDQTFAWRDLSVLPAYVEAYASYVSLRRDTEPFNPGKPPAEIPPTLGQLSLQRLRQEDVPLSSLPSSIAVFDRAPGFRERMRDLNLDARERRVLASIDGARTIDDLAQQTGFADVAVRRIVRCLEEIGLIAAARESGPVPTRESEGGSPLVSSQ